MNSHETTEYGQMILPDGKYYSLNDRETRLNNNVLIVGTTGSAKTRTVITPNLLECVGSYVVTDPKGNLYRKWGNYMEANGYRVVRLSFIHPEKSCKYNPLKYINTTQEIQKLSSALIYGSVKAGKSLDPFWDETALLLLNSMIGYLIEFRPSHEQTFESLFKLFRVAARDENGTRYSPYNSIMNETAKRAPGNWPYKQFQNVNTCADRTFNSVLISAIAKLSCFDTEELAVMMSDDEIDLASIGQRKTAVFVEVSDTDRSMDTLINTFFTQAMNQLCSYADELCKDSELPVPVRFFMDDFATNCRIDKFENMISNIRSRKISVMLVVQSLAQLTAGYGEGAHTIIDDCDTLIYMGGNDTKTAAEIAERCDKRMYSVLHMPLCTSWIFRRGAEPFRCHNMELDDYLAKREIDPDLYLREEMVVEAKSLASRRIEAVLAHKQAMAFWGEEDDEDDDFFVDEDSDCA